MGVASWPCVGVGGFLYSKNFNVGVGLVSLEALAQKGDMQAFGQFDNALEHRKMDKKFPTVALMSGEVLWIPYGFVPLVVANDPISTMISMPWPSKDLNDQIVGGTEIALAAMSAHIKKNPENENWAEVKKMIEMLQK